MITQPDCHAQEINGILATIQGIAEQTNLLALTRQLKLPVLVKKASRGFACCCR